MMRASLVRGIALLITLGAALGARTQTTGPRNPPLVIRSLAGRDLFEFYCATCHGRTGAGNGPVAPALKVMPADLTLLARRNGGTFPRQRVEVFVTNDGDISASAHGSSDMPVWGPVFRGLDPSDALVKVRIANVVKYVESLQVK
jgi:mono/diheme cytochrome c family protein